MNKNFWALGSSAIVFLGGAALTVLFYQLEIKDSATIIALLIMPLLVFGIASGKILEFSAPGGWSAKFQEVAKQKAGVTATPITNDMKELFAVPKADVNRLHQVMRTLPKSKPIALILYFERPGYQRLDMVKTYLNELRGADPNTVVILIDNATGRFVAMVEGDTFAKLLNSEQKRLIDAINKGALDYLRQINTQLQSAVFVFRKLTKKATNADALREMKQLGIRTMTVVDDADKPTSIVTREDILAHMFEELDA
jgi:hypothetical protein